MESGTINKNKNPNLENRIPNETIPAQLANISMHYDEAINNSE
jgi:hypothetical protein